MQNSSSPLRMSFLLAFCAVVFAFSSISLADEGGGQGASGSVNPFYGSFSTEVPIAVPEFHNIEPKLKLVYNSGGGNSFTGVGWSLSGQSAVVRSAPGGGTPAYDETDVFFFDGQELLPCTSQGGTHSPKIQNYTRIIFDDMDDADPSNDKWYVWGTNGNKTVYEPIYTTAKGTYSWLLTKVTDMNGNVVTYQYATYGDPIQAVYLDAITYNGSIVKFYRETRPDPIIGTNGAGLGRVDYRLKSIDISASGTRTRTYTINYATSQTTSRSLIQAIQQWGNDAVLDGIGDPNPAEPGDVTAGTSLPPMSMGYQIGHDKTFANAQATYGPGGTEAGQVILSDINADGRSDLIKHDGAGNVFTFFASDTGSFGSYSETAYPGSDSEVHIILGDINADGRTDLVMHDISGIIYTFLTNEDGEFEDTGETLTVQGGTESGYFHLADVNGDGRSDILMHDSSGTVYTYLADENGRYETYTTNSGTGGDGEYYLKLADVNGDSKIDLIRQDSSSTVHISLSKGNGDFEFLDSFAFSGGTNPGIAMVDVNGDGSPDLVALNEDDEVYTHLSNGDGTYVAGVLDSAEGNVTFADVNSDGRVDLVRFFDTGEVKTYLSNGDATFTYSSSTTGSGGEEPGMITFGDINGDGRPDMVKHDTGGVVYSYLSNGTGVPDVINHIENGIGGSTDITYTPSTEWDNTFMPPGMIIQTASKITTSDGRGTTSSMDYFFEGGLWSIDERRFLGFRKVTAVLDSEGNYTETYYYQKNGSISKPEFTYFKNNQGNLYRYSKYVYTENTEEPYTSLMTDRWEYDCNLSSRCLKTLTQFVYDQYGNVLESYEYGDYDLEGDERTRVRGYYPNRDEYILGLPLYENVYEGIGTEGKLIEQTLNYYDNSTLLMTRPEKGNLTMVSKWNDQTGDFVSVRIEYDQWGNVVKKFDELGYETRITFDPTYHVFPEQECKIRDGAEDLCGTMAWDYSMGLRLTEIDANNAISQYTFDPIGRPLTKTYPDGTITQFEHNNIGDPNLQHIRKYAAFGTDDQLWEEVYQDGLGREYKHVRQGGFVKETEFIETTSRVKRESLWYGSGETPQWVEYEYDGAGRMIKTYNPDGTFAQTVYGVDYYGKPYVASYDEMGKEKVTWKDVYGNLVQVREKNGDEYYYTTYEYDLQGNLVRVMDDKKNLSTFTWDTLGRKLSTDTPEMGEWFYAYNDDGSLHTQTDAKGQTVSFVYDDLGRLTTKTRSDGELTEYFYDEAGYGVSKGRLTRVVYPNGTGSEKHYYDIMGRETSVERCVEGTCYTIGQDYDDAGRTKHIIYPDNEVLTYNYDENGRLHDLSSDKEGLLTSFVDEMIWTSDGLLDEMTFGNRTRSDFTYDPARRWLKKAEIYGPLLPGPGEVLMYDADYTYSNSALVNSVSSTTDTLMNTTYGYDDLKRLISVSGSQEQVFDYDSIGNRVYANHESHPVTGIISTDFVYDDNGNMVRDGEEGVAGTRLFTWDVENRLTSVEKNGQVSTFLYGPSGNRIKKASPSGTSLYFGKLVEEVNGSMVKYYYAGNILVAKQETNGDRFWYHADRLGSTRVMTDSDGQEMNNYSYASFGRTLNESGTVVNERGYTGHVMDPDSGLIYMGARYYDATLGRFISPDTIVPDPMNPQALNRYAYAYNNPISYVDPSGHLPVAVAVFAASMATANIAIIGIKLVVMSWIGAAMSVVGYLTDNPGLSLMGSVMLGFAGGYSTAMMGWGCAAGSMGASVGGILGAAVAGATSPISPMNSKYKQAIGWAYAAYGMYRSYQANQDPLAQIRKKYDRAKVIEDARKMGGGSGQPYMIASADTEFYYKLRKSMAVGVNGMGRVAKGVSRVGKDTVYVFQKATASLVDLGKNGPPVARALVISGGVVVGGAHAAVGAVVAVRGGYAVARYAITHPQKTYDFISSSLPATAPIANKAGGAGVAAGWIYKFIFH